MASYHLAVKPISRKAGRSSTGAAAYRAAARIHDLRTGEIFDFTRKRGVVHRELVVPDGAPTWSLDRQALWNAAEKAETRKNSTVGREFEIALPAELGARGRQELVMNFARELVARHGMAVDVAIHAPHRHGDQRNYHAHLLCSTRRLTAEGFKEKTRELDDLWKGPAEVTRWRGRWADMQNEYLAEHGLSARVDHRSLKEQGIDRAPTYHKGPAVTGMERRGLETIIGRRMAEEQQRELQMRPGHTAERGQLEREAHQVTRSILETRADIVATTLARDRDPEHIAAQAAKTWAETYGRKQHRPQWEVAQEAAEKWARMRAAERERGLAQEQGIDKGQEHEHKRSRSIDDDFDYGL
jgi:ATP-dependent exoDNAse (exonuclease V) alpha subunit